VIDTLVHIRRQFGFTSNKLEYVQKLLNLHRKTDTGGMGLWIKCMAGDEQALTDMETYNVNDVRILEETYLHIRAWIKPHPNMGLFILDETQARCPSCGHDDLQVQGKPYYTSVNAYEVFRCNNCGSTGRKRTTTLDIKKRRNLLAPTAK
jgi:DNA-directed RNA polymerase subunit RPC12/RpoP